MTLLARCLTAIADCPRTAAEVAKTIHVPVKAASSALTALVKKGEARISETPAIEFDVRGCEHRKHVYEIAESNARGVGA